MVNKDKQVRQVNRALENHGLKPLAQPWHIKWVKFRGHTLGKATSQNGSPLVHIAEHLWGASTIKQAEDVYAHELIHHGLAANEIHEPTHGPVFKKVAYTAGLRNGGDQTWRYKHTCPRCAYWIKTHSRGKKAKTCRHCTPVKTEKRSAGKLIVTMIYQLMKVEKLW